MQSSLSLNPRIFDELPDFLTAKDICKLLRISRTALCNASKLSDFPNPIRISKRSLRWRKEDIATYLNGQGGNND